MTRCGRRSIVSAIAGLCLLAAQVAADSRPPKLPTLWDISLGTGEQVPTGFVGAGARGIAMGGAAIAGVHDGTALFWNPAALTRVPRLELLGGLAYLRPEATAQVHDLTSGAAVEFTRLNAAVLTAPYPVYRGAFVIAAGVARPNDYGYRAERHGVFNLGGKDYLLDDKVRQDGGLSQYAIGMGTELSPTVSLGLSAVWYHGGVNIRRDATLLDQAAVSLPDSFGGHYRQSADVDGVMLTIGTTARLPLGFYLGAVVTPPVKYSFHGTWSDAYEEAEGSQVYTYDEETRTLRYKIRAPWQLGLGLSWISYALTLSADVQYADWRQAHFDGAPFAAASGVEPATYFEDHYRRTFRWHAGGELLLPFVQTYVRGGAMYDPDPFAGPTLESGAAVTHPKDAWLYSAGVGWLIDKVLTVDVAYVTGGDRYTAGPLTETRQGRRAFVTTAFRF